MRGQAHTLEAVIAGLLLVSGLVFALQVTAVTPLSASTASQHVENQQRTTAEGVLAAADERAALKRAVLFWGDLGDETYGFHGADNGRYYTTNVSSNEFGALLDRTFAVRGIAYNVHVSYLEPDGDRKAQPMVYRGEPSDNAVTVTAVVTLYDDDVLYADVDDDGTAEPTGTTLSSTPDFYAPDAADSGVYNVVVVEVTVWRQ